MSKSSTLFSVSDYLQDLDPPTFVTLINENQ